MYRYVEHYGYVFCELYYIVVEGIIGVGNKSALSAELILYASMSLIAANNIVSDSSTGFGMRYIA